MPADRTHALSTDVPATWLAGALDELDYGVLLLDAGANVHHVNCAADLQLADGHPLTLGNGRVGTADRAHRPLLLAALEAAVQQGVRRMLTLARGESRTAISVVPLRGVAADGVAVMLVLGRLAPCMSLSAYGFATSFGLSSAEMTVLSRLIEGDEPARIAVANCVSLSTVRTQINSIRAKTGVNSLRLLIRELAMLPPLVSILGAGGAARH